MCRSTPTAAEPEGPGEPGEHNRLPDPPPAQQTAVIRITGKVARSDVPQLCAELGARIDEQHQGAVPVDAVCDVGALPADLVAVEAVARLHLTARRHGCRLRLYDVRPELRELLHLVGLGSLAEAAEPHEEPG